MEIRNINPYSLYSQKPLKFSGDSNYYSANTQNTVQPQKNTDYFAYTTQDISFLTDPRISRENLEKEVHAIVDRGCKFYGIPEELKPKIVIVDSIQFATEEEINKKFKEAMNKEDLDLDIFSGSKKSPAQMSRGEFINTISKKTGLSKKDVEKIIQTDNGKDKGIYSSVDNSITLYTKGYRDGSDTIEGTILHELYHAKEAITRSTLPQEIRDDIVKAELLDRLKEGEKRNIFKQYPSDDDMTSAMMPAPFIDVNARGVISDFANTHLFTEDWSLYEKMQRYSELLEQKNPDEEELESAKADLGGLAEEIEMIASNSKIYKSTPTLLQSLFGLTKKEKNKLLLDYMLSVEFRYQYFRQKEINEVPTTQKPDEYRAIAKKSISEHIDSTQANYAMNAARQTNKKTGDVFYSDYLDSREETRARIMAEKEEIQLLRAKYTNSIGNTPHGELKKIKKQLNNKKQQFKEDYKLFKLFEIEDKVKENPRNLGLRLKYFFAYYDVQLTKQSRKMGPLKKVICAAYLLIGLLGKTNILKKMIR